MKTQNILLAVGALLVVLFFLGGCKIMCNKSGFSTGTQSNIESFGFQRQCLGGGACRGMQRTPVDYAEKPGNGWQQNPHYKSYPSSYYQPADFGPIDFDKYARDLDAGRLFDQYRQDWLGYGKQATSMTNDEKNRYDLTWMGDVGARNQLDDMYNPAFGPKGVQNTERNYDEPNPYFDKIYGGSAYLTTDRLM